MEETHEACDHNHSVQIKTRTRWIFCLIFVPLCILLIRPFIARQLLYRASSYEASNMPQESIRQYRKSLFIDSDNAVGWNGLANVYKYCTGDIDKAIQAYKRSLETEPKNRRSLYELGMTLALEKQQYEEAASYWNQVRELGPESADERDRYIFSYHKLSLRALATYYNKRFIDPDKAKAVIEELNRYYPDDKEVEVSGTSPIDESRKANTSP